SAPRERQKKVLFPSGHGEKVPSAAKGGYAAAAKALEGLGYEVADLQLSQEGRVPADCDVLVVAGPEGPLLPEEEAAVRAWLSAGGRRLSPAEPLSTAPVQGLVRALGPPSLPLGIAAQQARPRRPAETTRRHRCGD